MQEKIYFINYRSSLLQFLLTIEKVVRKCSFLWLEKQLNIKKNITIKIAVVHIRKYM
jgi:hypothetical protein